jgi:retron-type reverse transcriptase
MEGLLARLEPLGEVAKQHQTLDKVYMSICTKKVIWVLDADLKRFFDNINHCWMLTFIRHRIADKQC